MATNMTTGKVRLSYVHVFEPYAGAEGQEPKYSVSIIIPKSDTDTLRKLNACIEEAKQVGKTKKWGGKIPAVLKLPLRDGDTDKPDDPAYANSYFCNCTSKRAPGVVDRHLNDILDPNAVYSGCYGRVAVNVYPFAAAGNKGIAVGLQHVQKVEDGEPLGGVGVSVRAAFDEYEDGLFD